MWDGLSLLDGEGSVIQREGGFIATGLRHGDKVPKILPENCGVAGVLQAKPTSVI